MNLSEMWPGPCLVVGAAQQGRYLLQAEHPKTGTAIIESFAALSSVVARGSELTKAGYRTEIWSPVSVESIAGLGPASPSHRAEARLAMAKAREQARVATTPARDVVCLPFHGRVICC
jgi:hypothetical protein